MPPRGYLAIFGAIFGCHNGGFWISWAEARGFLNILQCPNHKELLGPKFSGTVVEKPVFMNVHFLPADVSALLIS